MPKILITKCIFYIYISRLRCVLYKDIVSKRTFYFDIPKGHETEKYDIRGRVRGCVLLRGDRSVSLSTTTRRNRFIIFAQPMLLWLNQRELMNLYRFD